jgi:hypothetical protein
MTGASREEVRALRGRVAELAAPGRAVAGPVRQTFTLRSARGRCASTWRSRRGAP